MGIFLTGGTGYIGSYVVAGLLERSREPLFLLAREATRERLWRALQLHLDEQAFDRALAERITLVEGDLTRPAFGLSDRDRAELAGKTTSVLHIAASLNRKSEKACLNVNLRGTLHVVEFAREARDRGGLRRLSQVSTVAVAGRRQAETVREDEAIDWERSDYDPYARTKKFAEYLAERLLPDVERTVFRPSVVLGDSRRPETTQFDMVKAFVFLARMPVLPLRAADRIDIVPVDYVADAITTVHLAERPAHRVYHLSSGEDSQTYETITSAIAEAREKTPPWFWSWLEGPFGGTAKLLAGLHGTNVGKAAARLQVFLPYLTYNTVFDNARVVAALGRKPAPFTEYCTPLLRWSLEHKFQYPYREPAR